MADDAGWAGGERVIDYALHTNALLIAAELLTLNAHHPDIFQTIAEYHALSLSDMDEIRAVIAGPVAQMLRDLAERHRIVALMDARSREKRL